MDGRSIVTSVVRIDFETADSKVHMYQENYIHHIQPILMDTFRAVEQDSGSAQVKNRPNYFVLLDVMFDVRVLWYSMKEQLADCLTKKGGLQSSSHLVKDSAELIEVRK